MVGWRLSTASDWASGGWMFVLTLRKPQFALPSASLCWPIQLDDSLYKRKKSVSFFLEEGSTVENLDLNFYSARFISMRMTFLKKRDGTYLMRINDPSSHVIPPLWQVESNPGNRFAKVICRWGSSVEVIKSHVIDKARLSGWWIVLLASQHEMKAIFCVTMLEEEDTIARSSNIIEMRCK